MCAHLAIVAPAWADDGTVTATLAEASGPAEATPGDEALEEAVRAVPAAAPPVSPMRIRADSLLADGADWPAGTVGGQLDRDTTLVPYGKGALFVPALTNPLDEPPVTVLRAGQRVAEGTTGARIILSPGTYEVRVGSGTVDQRLRYQASVEEGHTTVIPVSWAGLAVHVVDEAYSSLRASYELIRVDDREYMGIGFGTDEQAGEPVTTWVMRPGLYKLVRLGDTYRARRDFATVRLVEGHHTHFLLVLKADSGEFAGGGEVPEDELFRARAGSFGSLVFGGDVTFNSRSGVPGLNDGLYFAFRGFLDARASLQIAKQPLLLRLQVEEGQSKGPNLPWQKSHDRVDLDALYVYQLKRGIGPYVRLGAETNVLSASRPFDEPTNVEVVDADGNVILASRNQESFELSSNFGLTTIKEGVGMNVRVFKSLFAETNVRAGVGARHRITNNLYEALDVGTSTTTFRRIPSSHQVGVELTVLAVARLTRWVLVNLELDSLFPFDNINNTVIELEASVALKLTSYVSVNYVVRYLRDRAIFLDKDRFEQDVLLRFSLEIF